MSGCAAQKFAGFGNKNTGFDSTAAIPATESPVPLSSTLATGAASAAVLASDRGYEASSEDTKRETANDHFNRRRSRSWNRQTQQLGRFTAAQNRFEPVNRRKRWRRKNNQGNRMYSGITAPPPSPLASSSTNSNCSNDIKNKSEIQKCTTTFANDPNSGAKSGIIVGGCFETIIKETKPQLQNQHNQKQQQQQQQQQLQQQQQQQQQQQHQQQQQQKQQQNSFGASRDMGSNNTIKTIVGNDGIKLTFHVQLAHGSPTGIISGFSNITQLYQKIANCYDEIDVEDILFCTVNTHRICMDALLCSNININDFIFAHITGQKKEVTLVKSEPALGLTITDNGAGKAFIKRIVPGSITSKAKPALEVGDFVEKINGESMIGKRHFDVARYLRTLPVGSTFTMRLVEPKRSGFNFISAYSKPKRAFSVMGATETIRFKADGTVVVQELPNALVINKMNDIFDSYLGFHDDDLAQTIWELVATSKDFNDLMNILKKSEMSNFDFPSELYFDLWGAVDDYRNGRLKKNQEVHENNAIAKNSRIKNEH